MGKMVPNISCQNTALVAYVPVLHQGYLEFFQKYPQAELIIIDRDLLTPKFRSLQKDIRALSTEEMVKIIELLVPKSPVTHLKNLQQVKWEKFDQIILPEDEISDWLLEKIKTEADELSDLKVKRDSIFLRWSQAKTKQKKDVTPDKKITSEQLQQRLMEQVLNETELSGDWWRQTAAAVVKEGKIITLAHNQHFPSDQLPYIFGDPRANASRGMAIEVTTALHAEEIVIGRAAREGVSLEGADLYVTTFPCPYCARLIAYTGIKRVFYHEGYSLLDGLELMQSQDIELIQVTFNSH